ncbi:MAG TPA: hypothetical protein VF032_04000 [Thermoleophilaceae bacterium]
MAKRGRIDMSRVASAALESALNGEQPQRRKRMSGVTAVAAGAALATAARVAVAKAPALTKAAALTKVPRLGDLTDSVRDRLAEHGWIEDEEPQEPEDEAYEDEYADEDYEDEPDEDEEEPEDEDDSEGDDWDDEDEPEDEDDDGPQAAGDEEPDEDEEEPEDEDEEDEGPPPIELGTNGGDAEASRSAPDLMASLSPRRRPPVMRGGDDYLDPADRPPEPPKKRRSKQTKSKAGRS